MMLAVVPANNMVRQRHGVRDERVTLATGDFATPPIHKQTVVFIMTVISVRNLASVFI